MRLFVFISLLIIGYITFDSLMEDYAKNPLDDEELRTVLKNDNAENIKLKKSFDTILKREKNSNKPAPRPVVKSETSTDQKDTIPIEYLGPDEIHNKFQKLWLANVQAGMDYLRSALFNEKVSLSTKEEILEDLSNSPFPKEEFVFFTREVLAQTDNPYFFRKVLYMHSESLSAERREILVNELLERTQNPEIKEVIQEFSVQMIEANDGY